MEEKHDITKIEEINLPAKDWSKELQLVKDITAKNCDTTEFKLLLFMAREYGLNPLKKEIWAVKYQDNPALIFVSRDGLLTIAHRSGQFGAMETTCELDQVTKRPVSATCTIWRKDFEKPFKNTVYFSEYNRKMALWIEKPCVMIMKVAESSCLRRAFNVSCLLTPEEMPVKDEVNNVSYTMS
jgi:phage recombination protein Bet